MTEVEVIHVFYYYPQITGSCDDYEVGDTEFTFKLSVNELSDNTIGYYSASFTNEGGTVSVGPARVTGRGKIVKSE